MKSLSASEKKFLATLSNPQKIQDYLESIPFNHEEGAETCHSVRNVLEHKKAHCLEGAMFACAALMEQNRKPLILSLKVDERDWDHVVALYKENGHWGAISKTNHAVLGFRDPVYRTIRELALSYFHEYFLVKNGEKTLRGYTRPINLNRFGKKWTHSEENLFELAEAIANTPIIKIIPEGNEDKIRRATKLDRVSASISHDGK